MGSDGSARKRRIFRVLALAARGRRRARDAGARPPAPAAGTTSGTGGTPGTKSLNLAASALEVTPGGLYVGGKFTDAGGIANADRIAIWNGATGTRSARRRSRSITVRSSPSPSPAASSTPVARSRTRGPAAPTTSRSGTARPGSRSAPTLNDWERQGAAGGRTDPLRRRRLPGRRGHRGRRLPARVRPGLRRAERHHRQQVHPFSGPVKALTATQ